MPRFSADCVWTAWQLKCKWKTRSQWAIANVGWLFGAQTCLRVFAFLARQRPPTCGLWSPLARCRVIRYSSNRLHQQQIGGIGLVLKTTTIDSNLRRFIYCQAVSGFTIPYQYRWLGWVAAETPHPLPSASSLDPLKASSPGPFPSCAAPPFGACVC